MNTPDKNNSAPSTHGHIGSVEKLDNWFPMLPALIATIAGTTAMNGPGTRANERVRCERSVAVTGARMLTTPFRRGDGQPSRLRPLVYRLDHRSKPGNVGLLLAARRCVNTLIPARW